MLIDHRGSGSTRQGSSGGVPQCAYIQWRVRTKFCCWSVILADGAVLPQEVVVGGSISIDRAAVKIHVGLQYFSDLQTLPLTLNIEAFGQGRVKNINQAWVRVFQSSGLFVGPTADKLTEAKMRTNEPYGSPPALRSDEIGVNITPTWAQGGQIYIRQADPLPLTIVGVTIEAVVGG